MPTRHEYERHKARAGARQRTLSAAGRDIGDIPPVQNHARRAAGEASLQVFCETYLQGWFFFDWSPSHLQAIDKIETVVTKRMKYAFAMPRGGGKTQLSKAGAIWALLKGLHRSVALIGATDGMAVKLLTSIKTILRTSDLLLADFPEVCYPIRCLNGEARRCGGQTHHGLHTKMTWKDDELILPTIPGSRASGAILTVAGITGNIRGQNHTREDGTAVRPTLAIVDDPQTDQSARSLTQTRDRLATINGTILGLSGPGQHAACIVPCTIIQVDDLADQLLDREKNPEWRGERTKMLNSLPTDEQLWAEYAEMRAEAFRHDQDPVVATEFYRKHRKKMDAGAEASWTARFDQDEISAIQHAMNIKFRNEAAFWAEYQNEPLAEDDDDQVMVPADEIVKKLNGLARGKLPIGTEYLTAYIDVQGKLLYWLVAAWGSDFTGAVVDYGSWPDQKRRTFTLRDAKKTIARAKPGAGIEGQVYNGLDQLCKDILSRDWLRSDGMLMQIDRCLIDANWGELTDTVYLFCQQSEFSARLLPDHGRYIKSGKTINDLAKKKSDRMGHHWKIPGGSGKRAIRHVLHDGNWWKTFVHSRLAVAMGDPGSLSLFGDKETLHRMLAEHLTAEFPDVMDIDGRQFVRWTLPSHKPDNHLYDCLVGAAVAASVAGASLVDAVNRGDAPRKRKKIKLSDIQRGRN